jgi:hypothetical protein
VVLHSTTAPCLHSKPLALRSRISMFGFMHAEGDFFFLWITVHPTRPQRCHDFASLRHNLVSATTPTRRSGVDRHGYPWVPTDQGPRGPCQVDPTCQKPRQPASGPRDLIHDPDDLGRSQATSSRLRETCRACGASFSPRSQHDASGRSVDCGICSVITEDDLPNM